MIANGYGISIHEIDGDYVVECRDLPEVVTSGDSFEEAMSLANDAVEVVVIKRIEDDRDLPEPSPIVEGEQVVALPAPLSAKAAVYRAWKASGLRKTELARRMNRNEVEVRRILDPRHGTKLDQLAEAALALGQQLVIGLAPVASKQAS